jgi:ABC-type polysaccharide/polyol phosphate export permease
MAHDQLILRRAAIFEYGAALWQRRFFCMSLVRHDLRSRYSRTSLGLLWSMLQPIAMTAVLCTVFSQLFRINVQEYAPYLLVGLAFWGFITTCCLAGCTSLTQAETYIRQYPAPMLLFTLRTTLVASYHFLVMLGLSIILCGLLRGSLPWVMLSLLPLALVTIFLVGLSLCTICAIANAYFPDMQHLLDVGLQMMFYLTPIMYPAAMMEQRGVGWLIKLNPFAALLFLLRDPIVEGAAPPLQAVLLALVSAATLAAVASYALSRVQKTLIMHL